MNSTNTPNAVCPKCSRANDKASDVLGDSTPSVGDFCVCGRCAAPLRYGPNMTLVETSVNEAKRLLPRDAFRAFKLMRLAIQSMNN